MLMDIQKCDHILKLCMLSIHYLTLKQKILLVLVLQKKSLLGHLLLYHIFSSSSSADTLVSRKLVAVVTNVKENDIEIEYGSAVSKKRIKFFGNEKGFISKDSILAILPQPNYKRGVYEFLDELEIDVFQ